MSAGRLLLCTDLDRTLLPNGEQSESSLARRRFAALCAHSDVTLAFVSGRDRERVEQAIKNYRLPQPDFVISDVGTRIYDLRSGGWQQWDQWQAEIAADWRGVSHRQLRELLAGWDELRLQEQHKQNTFKLSYYVPLYADRPRLDRELHAQLEAQDVRASLVWSVDEPAGIGLLDVLPRRATKLHAVEFLQAALAVGNRDTLFAGDSGNDLPILVSPIPSVLVANAMPEVVKEAVTTAGQAGNGAALYLARGAFLDMNGNYSAGILEGVAHYHPERVPQFAGIG